MSKQMTKDELRQLVFDTALQYCNEQRFSLDETLLTVFSVGCVFGFALNDPIQFEDWTDAGKAFTKAMEE